MANVGTLRLSVSVCPPVLTRLCMCGLNFTPSPTYMPHPHQCNTRSGTPNTYGKDIRDCGFSIVVTEGSETGRLGATGGEHLRRRDTIGSPGQWGAATPGAASAPSKPSMGSSPKVSLATKLGGTGGTGSVRGGGDVPEPKPAIFTVSHDARQDSDAFPMPWVVGLSVVAGVFMAVVGKGLWKRLTRRGPVLTPSLPVRRR